jgi:endonuclease/exonuclease/phosphatase family metal-dependent hydrolase
LNNVENITPAEKKKKRKGKRYFLNQIAMFCNHIAAVSLLVSYLASHVSPENFWFIAFFGLAYPLLVIINVLFIIYWSLQLKKRGFYSLIIVLAGWTNIHHYAQFSFNRSPDKSKKIIKVMSYNVKVFDLYNWSHNIDTRNKMFGLITDEAPEIGCFQEYFHRDSSKFANTDSLLRIANFKYCHIEYTSSARLNQHFGIATFSNYPIINKGKIDFGYKGNNVCIYSDILIGKDTVRVYNMHLQSIAFSLDDYKYVDELQKDVEAEDMEHSKNILKRLKRAFIKRSRQADLIQLSITSSPYPVIVCGDFNDTPASYTYNTISKNLNDAFVESGNGFGKSYIGTFPSFRIDYILHNSRFKAYNFKTIREELSDHFPVTCYLEIE